MSDRVMSVKLKINRAMRSVISAYALQVGCDMEETFGVG